MPRVAAIVVYPVKSCRGLRVKVCGLTAQGLEGDRRWLVTSDAGEVLSLKAEPRLSRVWVEQKGAELHLATAGMERLGLPLKLVASDGEPLTLQKGGQAVSSVAGSAWFSKFLGRPVRCVSLSGELPASDRAPLLATTTASLAELNQRMARAVGVERFRPNLVIEGTNPFDEDQWRAVKIGGVRFVISQGASRCEAANIDPATGERSEEPLATLKTFREHEGRVRFGINLVPELGGAPVQLRAGQTIEIER